MAVGRINTSGVSTNMAVTGVLQKTVNERGDQSWLLDGVYHRLDGPAYIGIDGTQEWFVNGRRHREDGPARIWYDGDQQWWVNGELHRTDGPAIDDADGQWWVVDGLQHRLDGPSYISPKGIHVWYIQGLQVTTEVEQWMRVREVAWPWDESTQVEFQLTWA